MDELIGGFGILAGMSTLIFGIVLIVMGILLPLIVFLGYGELRRIRRSTEIIEDEYLNTINESVFRIEHVDLRKIRESLDYLERLYKAPAETLPDIAPPADGSTNEDSG